MRYIDFRQSFEIPLFTSQDIRIRGLNITPSQLTDWQKKKFLTKVRGGVYVFNDQMKEITPEELSTITLEPSYVSLESVLSRHSLIPEAVFATTCITTKNVRKHNTYLGLLSYRHIKPSLFFGYISVVGRFRPYLIAEPEKALLDFFYLNNQYRDLADIEGLRIDYESFKSLNQTKLNGYAKLFPPRVFRMIALIRGQDD